MLSAVAMRATADCLNAWVKLRRCFLGTLVLLGEQCVLFPCLSSGVHSKRQSLICVHLRSSAVEIPCFVWPAEEQGAKIGSPPPDPGPPDMEQTFRQKRFHSNRSTPV